MSVSVEAQKFLEAPMAVGFLFLLTPLETFVFEGTLAVIADEALWVKVPERSKCAHYFTNLLSNLPHVGFTQW